MESGRASPGGVQSEEEVEPEPDEEAPDEDEPDEDEAVAGFVSFSPEEPEPFDVDFDFDPAPDRLSVL